MLEDAVRHNVEARNHLIPDAHMDWRQVLDELDRVWLRLRPFVTDVSVLLDTAIRAGQRVMFEGAQGTLLDIDHGTYPYVTSSNATTGGICTGLGIGPKHISAVMGVAKAYTTRVGEGPFPSELLDDMGQKLRDGGSEYGSVTGRPRRCGWFDAVALRYAVRVNGLDALAITKMDVLDGFETLEDLHVVHGRWRASRALPVGDRAARALRAGLPRGAGLDGADGRRQALRGSPGRGACLHRDARGRLRRARGADLDGIRSTRHDPAQRLDRRALVHSACLT